MSDAFPGGQNTAQGLFEIHQPDDLVDVFSHLSDRDREKFEDRIRELVSSQLRYSSVSHATVDLRGPYPVVAIIYRQGEPHEFALH